MLQQVIFLDHGAETRFRLQAVSVGQSGEGQGWGVAVEHLAGQIPGGESGRRWSRGTGTGW